MQHLLRAPRRDARRARRRLRGELRHARGAARSGCCALFGHPDARLLDGGIGRWRAERRPLTRDAVAEPEAASVLAVERHPEHLATVEDVLAALDRAT